MSTVVKRNICRPPLEKLVELFRRKLPEDFQNVEVNIVPCPNLKEEPFFLAAEGLNGTTAVADVGGVPYLVPVAQKNKHFDIEDVAIQCGISDAFVVGAGAGPWELVGVNSELMANIKFGSSAKNNTHIAKLNEDGMYVLEKLESSRFSILGNFFLSQGLPGEVLCVQVSQRKSDKDFISSLKNILHEEYKSDVVALGGVFLLKKGKAMLHVMPDFSETPLNTDGDVNDWLKFFEMSAPLICLTSFVSCDPGLDLRLQHTHCFSDHGEGGHYHNDTTPEEVEYLAFFNTAETIVRLGQPKETHTVGRD